MLTKLRKKGETNVGQDIVKSTNTPTHALHLEAPGGERRQMNPFATRGFTNGLPNGQNVPTNASISESITPRAMQNTQESFGLRWKFQKCKSSELVLLQGVVLGRGDPQYLLKGGKGGHVTQYRVFP